MKRKSIVALLIAVIMIVSFAGCGSKEEAKSLSAEEIIQKASEAGRSRDFEMTFDLGVEEGGQRETIGIEMKGTIDDSGNFYTDATLAVAGTKESISFYFIADEMTVYADLEGTAVKADLNSLYDTFAPAIQEAQGIDSSVIEQLRPSNIRNSIKESKESLITKYFDAGKPSENGDNTVIELTPNEKTLEVLTESFEQTLRDELGDISASQESMLNEMVSEFRDIAGSVKITYTVNKNYEPVSVKCDLAAPVNEILEAIADISGEKLDEKCTKAAFEIRFSNVGKASAVAVPDSMKNSALDLVMLLPYLLQ